MFCENDIISEAKETVPINAEKFPDFYFQKYVQEKIDVNKDGILDSGERDAVTEISTSWGNYAVHDFKGIEHFSNLENLYINGFYHPGDEAGNQSVISMEISLDISKNLKLKSLNCSAGKVVGLDVSRLSQLERLILQVDLKDELDLSSNKKLKEIIVSHARLAGELPDLQLLEIRDNVDISNLNLLASKKLRYLRMSYHSTASKLYLSGLTELQEVSCSLSNIPEINLDGCTSLRTVSLHNNKIQKLSVNNCTNLKELDCGNNGLIRLDVGTCRALRKLDCNRNQIRKLDLRKNKKLNEVECSRNPLDSLCLFRKGDYRYINTENANLTFLDLRKVKIRELKCSNNKLKSLK